MRPGKRTLAGLLLSAGLLQGACSDTPSGLQPAQASLTLRLTDAPGDFHAAVVTISEIYLQSEEDGRTVVSDEPLTTDLLTLANTATVIVNNASVPAGTYDELRFVITGAYIEVEDDVGGTQIYASSADYEGLPPGVVPDGVLQMPSLGQSGLKVNFDGALVLDGEHDFLIDFDVEQSFGQEAGNSGMWVMHPVITGGQTSEAATIVVTVALDEGVTLPEVDGTQITLADFLADKDGQTLAFEDDGSGGFQASFRFLLPGSYAIALIAPAGLTVVTDPAGPVNQAVAAGETVTVHFLITEVTEDEE
jgi:hypothetical protein